MQKSEIGAGLRQNYADLNTINNNLRPEPNGPTGQQDYLPPLQPAPAAGEGGSRTIRKNADNSFSISRTTPMNGGGDIKVPFRDLAYHAGGKSKLGSRDPMLLKKAQQLQTRVDALKGMGREEDRERRPAPSGALVRRSKPVMTPRSRGWRSRTTGCFYLGQPGTRPFHEWLVVMARPLQISSQTSSRRRRP